MDDFFFTGVDETEIRRQKAKARELRKSRWWQNTIAKGICHYCGQNVPATELTMDHIVPIARGGKSTRNNLAPCCKTCNNRKKTMLPMEWEEYMENRRPD